MDDNYDDYDLDDVLNDFNKKKKKKKNSGRKGKRGERGLIEELEERFPGKPFSRTLGSGNRWSQARLTETAKKVFTGDIVTPEDFLFALECKHGYNHISLERAVKRVAEGKRGNKQLDEFLEQAEKDGERVHKQPMMCWKKDYKPWIAFLKTDHLPPELRDLPERVVYHEWSILPLVKVLERPDGFFFKVEA
jgi:hypothetical protein